MTPCPTCEGRGHTIRFVNFPSGRVHRWFDCPDCNRLGFVDVPVGVTDAVPGSQEKVAVLAARYDQGLPLWNDGDRRDHEGLCVVGGETEEFSEDCECP